ncbi:NrdR family transcriptional regulator [Streptomyces hydrogenans]|uniref:NrdR family transcriptional regulator n=1 Tax=Streptomyces hydrogenans TaxID=1873719 RepID=UPI003556F8FD
MQCPFCTAPTSVLAIEENSDGCSIRRRRLCSGCARTFTTVETASLQANPLRGLLTPFSRCAVITKVRTAAQRQPEVEDAAARRSRARKPSPGSGSPLRLPSRRSSESDVNGHEPFTLFSASGRG